MEQASIYISVYAFILPSCFATYMHCHIIYESYIVGRRLLVMMANCLRRCLDQFMKCSVGLSVPWWARKLQCQESLRGLVSLQVSVSFTCCSSHSGLSAVSCGHKSNTGFFYPLDKGLIFVHKPTVYIKYEQVACVNFARVSGGGGASNRSFDLEVDLKNGNSYTFSSIMKCVMTCVTCLSHVLSSTLETIMEDCLTSSQAKTSK